MGISVSRYMELSGNELIARFCSTEPICPNDPFWNQMLAFNITPPGSPEEQLIFDSNTEALLQSFLQNNPQTGNLGSLVQVFITRATELLASPTTDNAMFAWQTFNALFVIRAVIKYLVEMLPEYQLNQHLDVMADRRPRSELDAEEATEDLDPLSSATPPPSPSHAQAQGESKPRTVSSESRLEMLCDALVGLICDVPLTDNTYYLHLECINTILTLLSVYMFAGVHGASPERVERERIYRTVFRGRYGLHAPLLVKTLLNNFASAQPAPAHMFGCADSGGSLVINLAAGLWNMLTFSTSTSQQTIYTNPPEDATELRRRLVKEHPVANQSCLLLLALTNHCINEDTLYRRALLCNEDVQETSTTTPSKESNGIQNTPPRIEMAALHKALCVTASCEHSTLLLYLMLHSCKAYKRHVLDNLSSIDTLIVPILQCLYEAPDTASHHIYMSLIVLLILTEEDSLTKAIHQIDVKNPTWYTERALPSISLGGLMVLVLVRAAQHNIVRVRDKYLHTNCLAAIANMSGEFRNLHPYVAQRLVSIYETLSKRRVRLYNELENGEGELKGLDIVHGTTDKVQALWDHICVLDEVLRMVVEILNSCLCSQLTNNLNLVYALLHKKTVFAEEAGDHAVLSNIRMVIGYFSSRLQRVREGAGGDLSVSEVLACIKKGAEQWSNDRLKKYPELKFRYVEEERPEEFFTPYVWGLISSWGAIYWSSECSDRAIRDLVSC